MFEKKKFFVVEKTSSVKNGKEEMTMTNFTYPSNRGLPKGTDLQEGLQNFGGHNLNFTMTCGNSISKGKNLVGSGFGPDNAEGETVSGDFMNKLEPELVVDDSVLLTDYNFDQISKIHSGKEGEEVLESFDVTNIN
jgi:hypothetical protein